ncbi:hypothetical protein [Streptomyces sp. NPDC060188]|uniref:hypothetical protein n=1 Tax=Streptomyces sp. NPDC060188 TaxID=3347068 RepID=UPI00366783B1
MTSTPDQTPRNQLYAAASRLRAMRFPAAMTATSSTAALIGARLPLAQLLEAVASNALENDHEECARWCSPDTCDLSAALAVARAITP